MLGAITPAVTFLASPLWGILADRLNKHKLIMLLTFIGSVFARAGFLLIPSTIGKVGVLVALSASLSAPVRPLMDAAVMKILENKELYGRTRLFGQIGFGLGSYLVGPFLEKNMRCIFFAHLLLAVPTAVVMLVQLPGGGPRQAWGATAIPTASVFPTTPGILSNSNISNSLKTRTDTENNDKRNLAELFKQLKPHSSKLLLFFGIVYTVGTISGLIENFAFNRIAQTATTGKVGLQLGLFTLASSVSGGPMFWLSGKLIQRIGVNGIIICTLIAYSVRFFIYSAITQPWQAFPAEIIRGATFASFWAATTYFVYGIAPPGFSATMVKGSLDACCVLMIVVLLYQLGALNGVYAGLGQSTGSLIGGKLCERYGIAGAFKRAGIGSIAITLIYSLLLVMTHNSSRERLQ
jgi:MFS family permease